MNILYRILFILLIVPSLAGAQTISLLENDTTSVIGAHVFCRNIDTKKEYTFLADANGKVHLNDVGAFDHLAITVYALGFERMTDTIDSKSDKRYILKPTQNGLNELVVTAQYAPNDPEKAVHNIKIIDAKKIQAMAAVNLRDVLTNELNIRIGQDGILGSSMTLQGVSGQNVKILMDGVPVIGRTDGEIDISQINMNNVERVEIVEGPLSVSYGTDALAGTINIITKKNVGHEFIADAQAYYESTGQYNLNATLGYSWKNQSLRVNGGRNYFDGWNPGDKQFDFNPTPIADSSRYKAWKPKEQYFGNLNYGYRFKGLQFYYTLDYFKETIYNKGLPQTAYDPSPIYIGFDETYKTTRLNNAVSVDGKISSKFRLNGVLAYNYYRRNKNRYSKNLTSLQDSLTSQFGDQDTSVATTLMSRATISTFDANSNFNYEIGYDAKLESATGARIEGSKQSMGDYAAFASAEWKPVENFTIRPGVRVAYNTRYNAPIVPSINLKYTIPTVGNGSVNIRASYARGFRAPTIKELYFDFVDINHTIIGNPDLKAEYSNNFNFSINYIRSKGEWSYKTEASAFYNAFTNKIDLAVDSSKYVPGQTSPVPMAYFNVSSSKTLGVIFQQTVSYQHLKLTVGGSYIGTYNDLSESESVPAQSYSPEFKANLFYEWHKPQMTFGVFYKYNGSVPGYGLNDSGQVYQTKMDAYNWMDCSVSKLFFQRKLNVSIGSKNIFDIKNVAQTGTLVSNGSPHSGGTGSTLVGMGRSYFVTLTYHFSTH